MGTGVMLIVPERREPLVQHVATQCSTLQPSAARCVRSLAWLGRAERAAGRSGRAPSVRIVHEEARRPDRDLQAIRSIDSIAPQKETEFRLPCMLHGACRVLHAMCCPLLHAAVTWLTSGSVDMAKCEPSCEVFEARSQFTWSYLRWEITL